MKALKIVAVSSLFFFGVQAMVTERDYHSKITLCQPEIDAAFAGLDVVGKENLITSKDLDHHYYHCEVAFAKKRFIEWIDSKDADKNINKEELKTFISGQIVILAIHECSFIRSKSLMEFCFSDQILTYIMLVLDKTTVGKFFNKIEKPDDNDKDITMDELKEYLGKVPDPYKVEFCDEDVTNMLTEIGGSDKKISPGEWEEYVTQEDLHDDFRICRKSMNKETFEAEYSYDCLVSELFDWTKNHFTERDCEDTFGVFDEDKDGDIEANEVKNGCPECSDDDVARFIKMLDKPPKKDGIIVYAEFRAFTRGHWARLELEKHCSVPKKTQKEEVECYVKKIVELAKDQHTTIWLAVPDLDMVFEFEQLDANDNGRIELEEDLKEKHQWDDQTAKNFIAEFDGPDKDVHVSLQEFNEVVDEPHFVYATADCLDHVLDKKPDRIDCYNKEIHDTLVNILDKMAVKAFFDFYDDNNCGKITKNEVEKRGVTGGDVVNFMKEMGMGDETIVLREFSWYVKQQRITKMITDNKCGKDNQLLHGQMVEYHKTVFTEYDTQEVFYKLDKDHDWEITSADCGDHKPPKHQSLVARIDRHDDHGMAVNFAEFWVFLNSPLGGPIRKTQLETTCTIQLNTQEEEMQCYLEHIWDVK